MYPGLKPISAVNAICIQHSAGRDHWAGPAIHLHDQDGTAKFRTRGFQTISTDE